MHKASYMCLMPIRFIFDGTTEQYPDTVCERDNVMKSAFINKDSERCALRRGRVLPTHYPPPQIHLSGIINIPESHVPNTLLLQRLAR